MRQTFSVQPEGVSQVAQEGVIQSPPEPVTREPQVTQDTKGDRSDAPWVKVTVAREPQELKDAVETTTEEFPVGEQQPVAEVVESRYLPPNERARRLHWTSGARAPERVYKTREG